MSRVYEALRQMEKDQGQTATSSFPQPATPLADSPVAPTELEGITSVEARGAESSRLVALWGPRSLGGEKFRALVTRLENLRRKREMKSLQITSGSINEGKTLVAANLAVTFAKHNRSKVLLLEGDLHRPTLTTVFGFNDLAGIDHWWSDRSSRIEQFIYRLKETSLFFLGAGTAQEHASDVIQSTRFADAFNQLTSWFDWIIVDSTPMLPVADANLWSRLVDGTLLVVRKGVSSVKALQQGLESLDNLKLVGTVLNEASESGRTGSAYHYYSGESKTDQKLKKNSEAAS